MDFEDNKLETFNADILWKHFFLNLNHEWYICLSSKWTDFFMLQYYFTKFYGRNYYTLRVEVFRFLKRKRQTVTSSWVLLLNTGTNNVPIKEFSDSKTDYYAFRLCCKNKDFWTLNVFVWSFSFSSICIAILPYYYCNCTIW